MKTCTNCMHLQVCKKEEKITEHLSAVIALLYPLPIKEDEPRIVDATHMLFGAIPDCCKHYNQQDNKPQINTYDAALYKQALLDACLDISVSSPKLESPDSDQLYKQYIEHAIKKLAKKRSLKCQF